MLFLQMNPTRFIHGSRNKYVNNSEINSNKPTQNNSISREKNN